MGVARRSDARRNYDRLLAEADRTFREHGTDASLGLIARRAGVAIGTLYGHFPTRRALVGALLRDRHDSLFAHGDDLCRGGDAAAGFETWIRAAVEHAATYRGLAALLADGTDDPASELHADCARMSDIGETLLADARTAGAVREEVTAADVLAVMNAAAWLREHTSAEQSDRLLDYTLAGLRPSRKPRHSTTKPSR